MKGTYILFMEAKKDIEPDVGGLGRLRMARGLYAYVGSAMGKGVSLESRVGRHKKMAETKKGERHWHIDYFTASKGVEITGVVKIIGKAMECDVARAMVQAGATVVERGFGSSDCGCDTHFFGITQGVAEKFMAAMPEMFSG